MKSLNIFLKHSLPLQSNTYFQGRVKYVQYGFLYLTLTRPKITVHSLEKAQHPPETMKNLLP
jgi:hypothetical protein